MVIMVVSSVVVSLVAETFVAVVSWGYAGTAIDGTLRNPARRLASAELPGPPRSPGGNPSAAQTSS
jgi:hypothetical protein